MGPATVPFVAGLALVIWAGVAVVVIWDWIHGQPCPDTVVEAAALALGIALVVGFASALGFMPGVLPGGLGTVLAAGWRAAVLACGVYAFIGAWRARA